VQTENRSKKKIMFAGKQHSQQQHPKLLNSTVAQWSTSLVISSWDTATGLPQHHVKAFKGIEHLSHFKLRV